MPISFTPNNWQNGDTLTAVKMNNPETALSNTVALVNTLETEIGNIPATGTVTVGTTTTGEPGTEAVVSNSGTAPNVVLDFTIPRGAVGATGPKGDTGETGPQGLAGAEGPAGLSVTAVALTLTTTDGAVTGGTGTVTLSDDSTAPITVTVTPAS